MGPVRPGVPGGSGADGVVRRDALPVLTDKQARQACGITQEAVQRALGACAGSVSQWENGVTRPRLLAHREAYRRVYAGFRRHLAVPEEP